MDRSSLCSVSDVRVTLTVHSTVYAVYAGKSCVWWVSAPMEPGLGLLYRI
eukprot:IDg19805t1